MKIYLIIFSDQIPDTLITNLKNILRIMLVLKSDLRREFNRSKFKLFKMKLCKKIIIIIWFLRKYFN